MLECVVNISDGQQLDVVAQIGAVAGSSLLDLHSDPHHNRSVLTLGGPDVVDAVRCVASATIDLLDLRDHSGVHPRLGVLDVVPFVPLGRRGVEADAELTPALLARDDFAEWAAKELALPCFLYGPERALPEIRRLGLAGLGPDAGPEVAQPRTGATCVGARAPLVAYNLWLDDDDIERARLIARQVRSAAVRTLGLMVGDRAQVSCNLVQPFVVGPGRIYDEVNALGAVEHAELVGLLPAGVLTAEPRRRWTELDLDERRTVEFCLAAADS